MIEIITNKPLEETLARLLQENYSCELGYSSLKVHKDNLEDVKELLNKNSVDFIVPSGFLQDTVAYINSLAIESWQQRLSEGDDELSFEKRHSYMLKNWQSYNVVDSEEDFTILLNMLEANGETLDSLHHTYFNGLDEFMGIIGFWDSDRDIASAVFEFNIFYKDIEELALCVIENAWFDDIEVSELIDDMLPNLKKTYNGYVQRIYY